MTDEVKQSLYGIPPTDSDTEQTSPLRRRVQHLSQGVRLLRAASPFTKIQHAEALVSETIDFCQCLIEHIDRLQSQVEDILTLINRIEEGNSHAK